MTDWTVTQLTFPGAEGWSHSHSYYDIPVLDGAGARIIAHRLQLTGRHPTPEDAVELGIVQADAPGSWQPLGESRAWSWQQGPLAQWVGGGPRVVWNDREDGRIVARLHDTETGETRTLPGQIYAVDPAGRVGLSLDMTRLSVLRPGYGYPGGVGAGPRCPKDAGIWRIDLETGAKDLIVSLERAVRFLNTRRPLRDRLGRMVRRVHYWFNHAKISPDGTRFTVKLRWRKLGQGWSDHMGVSLTCKMDGSDLRLMDSATSHVIWLGTDQLYFWRLDGLYLNRDDAPEGKRLEQMAPDLIRKNVHMRHLDPEGRRFVLDTPYQETVALLTWDRDTGQSRTIAEFPGHDPANGPFRCDLHPCPSADGRRVVVTSLKGGTRQIHLCTASRTGDAPPMVDIP